MSATKRRIRRTGGAKTPAQVGEGGDDASVKPTGSGVLPAGYPPFLADIKTRIRSAQIRAALASNRELVELYWDIGKSIVERQAKDGWGRAVVERLAVDLQAEFPGVGGFSQQNLWYMRRFYLAWAQEDAFLQQPVGELTTPRDPKAVGQAEAAVLPRVLAELPWGQNIVLLEKLADPAARLWYARMAFQNGWSRSVLTVQIKANLFQRQGKAITNFLATLPPPHSDLAQQALKDPYVFDFLTLTDSAREREVEDQLVGHLAKLLLEMGAGFAFVGRQYHIEVAKKDYYLDLLFYHTRLHCYVVVELKAVEFQPEFAGKLNFYLSAVDDRLRRPEDKPTIGLLLCRTRDRIEAEYALRDIRKPIGVAEWETKLVRRLPTDLRPSLPTVKEIEAALAPLKQCKDPKV